MTEKIETQHKPIMETMINTTALAITSYGTALLLQKDYFGLGLVLLGAFLEFGKYLGRKKLLW